MSTFWVIDTKVKVLPQSSLPQDGSTFYFGRSIVPADSKELAISTLSAELESDFMLVEEISDALDYESRSWNSEADEEFETEDSYQKAKLTGNIALGCFVSELSMEG